MNQHCNNVDLSNVKLVDVLTCNEEEKMESTKSQHARSGPCHGTVPHHDKSHQLEELL
jgi:hypothetical protein